jgi:hypothetical protein
MTSSIVFDVADFGGFSDFEFGVHAADAVELSSMHDPKGDDGYYTRLEIAPFE